MIERGNPIRDLLEAFGRTRVGAWFILNIARPFDEALLRMSRGRLSSIQLFFPTLLLTTIGAKSGLPRQVPLVFIRDGERLVVIASNGGQANLPAWYYNLRANPRVSVTYGGQTRGYTAREAEGEERDRLWARALTFYRGYGDYKIRAAHRSIPVLLLTPEP